MPLAFFCKAGLMVMNSLTFCVFGKIVMFSSLLQDNFAKFSISSVQFRCSIVSDSLRLHGLKPARLPCPSPTPRAYSNSCPLSRWCHPTKYSIFGSQFFFSFNILSMSPNCLLTCKSSAEKSTDSLVEIQWLPIILRKNPNSSPLLSNICMMRPCLLFQPHFFLLSPHLQSSSYSGLFSVWNFPGGVLPQGNCECGSLGLDYSVSIPSHWESNS